MSGQSTFSNASLMGPNAFLVRCWLTPEDWILAYYHYCFRSGGTGVGFGVWEACQYGCLTAGCTLMYTTLTAISLCIFCCVLSDCRTTRHRRAICSLFFMTKQNMSICIKSHTVTVAFALYPCYVYPTRTVRDLLSCQPLLLVSFSADGTEYSATIKHQSDRAVLRLLGTQDLNASGPCTEVERQHFVECDIN